MVEVRQLSPETSKLIETSAIVAIVGAVIAAIINYVKNLNGKISRNEFDKAQADLDQRYKEKLGFLEARLLKVEDISKDFAGNTAALKALSDKVDRIETRIEEKLDTFWKELTHLLRDNK